MSKSKGIKVNVSEADASKIKKMSKKELGKSIGGNPDATDEKWINIWIDMYEKAYPGRLKRMATEVQMEISLSKIDKNATVSKESDMHKAFWLPQDLEQVLEAAYPSFWTNDKHARWFCRHFPIFAFATYARRTNR